MTRLIPALLSLLITTAARAPVQGVTCFFGSSLDGAWAVGTHCQLQLKFQAINMTFAPSFGAMAAGSSITEFPDIPQLDDGARPTVLPTVEVTLSQTDVDHGLLILVLIQEHQAGGAVRMFGEVLHESDMR